MQKNAKLIEELKKKQDTKQNTSSTSSNRNLPVKTGATKQVPTISLPKTIQQSSTPQPSPSAVINKSPSTPSNTVDGGIISPQKPLAPMSMRKEPIRGIFAKPVAVAEQVIRKQWVSAMSTNNPIDDKGKIKAFQLMTTQKFCEQVKSQINYLDRENKNNQNFVAAMRELLELNLNRIDVYSLLQNALYLAAHPSLKDSLCNECDDTLILLKFYLLKPYQGRDLIDDVKRYDSRLALRVSKALYFTRSIVVTPDIPNNNIENNQSLPIREQFILQTIRAIFSDYIVLSPVVNHNPITTEYKKNLANQVITAIDNYYSVAKQYDINQFLYLVLANASLQNAAIEQQKKDQISSKKKRNSLVLLAPLKDDLNFTYIPNVADKPPHEIAAYRDQYASDTTQKFDPQQLAADKWENLLNPINVKRAVDIFAKRFGACLQNAWQLVAILTPSDNSLPKKVGTSAIASYLLANWQAFSSRLEKSYEPQGLLNHIFGNIFFKPEELLGNDVLYQIGKLINSSNNKLALSKLLSSTEPLDDKFAKLYNWLMGLYNLTLSKLCDLNGELLPVIKMALGQGREQTLDDIYKQVAHALGYNGADAVIYGRQQLINGLQTSLLDRLIALINSELAKLNPSLKTSLDKLKPLLNCIHQPLLMRYPYFQELRKIFNRLILLSKNIPSLNYLQQSFVGIHKDIESLLQEKGIVSPQQLIETLQAAYKVINDIGIAKMDDTPCKATFKNICSLLSDWLESLPDFIDASPFARITPQIQSEFEKLYQQYLRESEELDTKTKSIPASEELDTKAKSIPASVTRFSYGAIPLRRTDTMVNVNTDAFSFNEEWANWEEEFTPSEEALLNGENSVTSLYYTTDEEDVLSDLNTQYRR